MNKHFYEYNEICNQIVELEYKLITKKDNLYSVKGVSYDDMPKGNGNGIDIVFKINEIDELEERLNVLKESKTTLYDKHIQEIALIDKETHRSVLRAYYLLKMDVKDIAEMMNKTPNHISKLKRDATEEFVSKIIANDRQ